MSVKLAYDAQEEDAPVVNAITSVLFVLIEGDNLGISHVSRYCSFTPNTGKEHHRGAVGMSLLLSKRYGGIPSLPGALPLARQCLYSNDGSASSSSMLVLYQQNSTVPISPFAFVSDQFPTCESKLL